jgi:hypothetical protein
MSFGEAFDRSRRGADRVATWDDWRSMVISLEFEREWDNVSRLLQPQVMPALILTDGAICGGGG